MKTIIAMTAALVMGAGAAQAQGPSDAISLVISYADLDLSQETGRKVLERRVSAAVNRVCPDTPLPQELRKAHADRVCHRTATAGARQQMAAIFGGQQLAQSAVRVSGRSD